MLEASHRRPAPVAGRVRRIVDVVFFGVVPLLPFLPVAVQLALRRRYVADGWFYDMHWLWVGWGRVVHGQNPYPDFLYPPPAAVIPSPLGLLGYRPAAITWSLILAASFVVALRVLGVRDWRCYGIALMSMPALSSVHLGSPTPLLVLAAACAWRYRDRPWVVSAAVAFAVGFKLFLWPLIVWLAVTRLWTSIRAGLTTLALVIGCWAVIGFAGVTGYGNHLTGTVSSDLYRGLSVIALAHRAGLGLSGAKAVAIAAGLAATLLIVVVGRRRGLTSDRDAFIAALAATLLASPVVWGHYFLLVYVAFALSNQDFGIEWLAPLAFWAIPQQENSGSTAAIVIGLALFVGLLLWSARREEIIGRIRRLTAPDQPIDRAPLAPRVGPG